MIKDQNIVRRGAANMIWGIAMCVATGLFVGFLLCIDGNKSAFEMQLTNANKSSQSGVYSAISLNTSQILSRGPPVGNVISSFIVAVLSGIAIALGQSSGIASALAGCAMSTSLLPPLVNVGLMIGLLFRYGNMTTINNDSIMQVLTQACA